MLRDPNEGWSSPPPEPPRDYAPDDDPPYEPHPWKLGVSGALVAVAAFALSPLIIVAVVVWLWWEAFKWSLK